MAYMALYRAYRPINFSEVVGQKHIVTTLKNAIKMNKVAHAYLFSGPRGTGKTSLAKIMAKTLNCENKINDEPCNVCDICKGINKGMISDVIEIDAASNNGVDAIRELRDGVKFLPSIGKYKVYIIDEVHMLSNSAFNALLKTLEEPPAYVVFILATTEPYNVPATILSRCQRFDFKGISNEDILKRLEIVCNEEKINIETDALCLIAEASEGGMRDALSLLDQSISYSSDDLISLDDVLSVSGNVNNKDLLNLIKNILDNSEIDALNILDNIIKEGKEVSRIINDLMLLLRDILLFKNRALTTIKSLYESEEFIYYASKISKPLIYNWLNLLNECQNDIKFSNQKRAFLELTILKMCDKEIQDYTLINDRINQLEILIDNLLSKGIKESPKDTPQVYEIKETNLEELTKLVNEATLINEDNNVEIINEIVVEPPKISKKELFDDSLNITVRDLEEVLNNFSKPKRERLEKEIWPKIQAKYANVFIVQILCNGKIVAASDSKVIITLADEDYCNRVMKYENHIKIMEIINNRENLIDDYYCIPESVWKLVSNDYRNQTKNGITKPILNMIEINVKKRIVPTENNKIDPLLEVAYDLFDKDIIKIMED